MVDRLKYDKTMAKAIRSIPKPLKFTMDIVEHMEYIEVRVYENQLMQFNDSKRVQAMEYLNKIDTLLKSFGLKSFIGGSHGDPPRR
jgi:hypothetical protein